MSYGYWKTYVPVATRREQARKAVSKASKAGQTMQPVQIDGRAIATTFWGKAWCENLEAYSDYANRLPRGRSYLRNGSVIDLKIAAGKVHAQVMGSSLYRIEIGIAAVPAAHWQALSGQCTGSIASLVELLQGRLSKALMEHICQPNSGLFPAPKEIKFKCSCPDWASMCKHVAAALYGVGARLDAQPELLFTLRQVDANDLVSQAAELPARTRKAPAGSKLLDAAELADVFGIEIDSPTALPLARKQAASRRSPAAQAPTSATKKPTPAAATKKAPARPQPVPAARRKNAPGKSTKLPAVRGKPVKATAKKSPPRKITRSATAATKRKTVTA